MTTLFAARGYWPPETLRVIPQMGDRAPRERPGGAAHTHRTLRIRL